MRATIVREYKPEVTFGIMSFYDDNGKFLMSCKTLELPDKQNKTGESCIPETTYKVSIMERSNAIKYEHFWIENVVKREGIKIHSANFVSQLRGCIAVGSKHVDMNNDGIIDVSDSVATLKTLLSLVKKYSRDNIFYLTITH